MLYQITAPHFVAVIETAEYYTVPLKETYEKVVCAAPIISYMRGKRLSFVKAYCKGKHWGIAELETTDAD